MTLSDFGSSRTYPGTLRGFRWWWYLSHELQSLNFNPRKPDGELRYPWKNLSITARCFYADALHYARFSPDYWNHPAPEVDCTCGVYAFYNPWRAYTYTDTDDNKVFGVVECSGTIIPGTKGFRAQHAKVSALHSPVYWNRILLRKDFPGTPVFDTMDDLVTNFRPHDPPTSED